MNIDEQLAQQFGRERKFCVPENYFNDFHKNIMCAIEETVPAKTITTLQRIRPYIYAAACAALLIICTRIYMQSSGHEDANGNMIAKSETTNTNESSLEQAAYYMMIDNNDMFAYLSDE